MKTKLLIFIWLIILTIFMLWIHGQMKEYATNPELLDIQIRMDILEADLQRNKDRATREIKAFHQNRNIVPVGRGILLAVEREDKDAK